MIIRKNSRFALILILALGTFFSIFGVSKFSLADTSDETVNFTFQWNSAWDYTNARRKDNTSSMYMRVNSSNSAGSFNVWAEADANVWSGGRDWKNASGDGKHEGAVQPGRTYLFINNAVETYGKQVPVRFGGYSRENNSYNVDWSPDSVRPKGSYTEY